jgi:hypothetical protein
LGDGGFVRELREWGRMFLLGVARVCGGRPLGLEVGEKGSADYADYADLVRPVLVIWQACGEYVLGWRWGMAAWLRAGEGVR